MTASPGLGQHRAEIERRKSRVARAEAALDAILGALLDYEAVAARMVASREPGAFRPRNMTGGDANLIGQRREMAQHERILRLNAVKLGGDVRDSVEGFLMAGAAIAATEDLGE